MPLEVQYTSQFKRDLKKAKRQNKDLSKLKKIIYLIQAQAELPPELRDHALVGNWSDFRELHVTSDWLLIYKVVISEHSIILTRLGSHAELFR